MIGEFILLIILIILSGYFSGSEIAFFSINDIKVRQLVKEKKRGSRTLQKLKSEPEKLLITLLIGNNIVNIGASAYATILTMKYFGNAYVGLSTGILTFVVLMFGEITPKAIATKYNAKISLMNAKVFLFLRTVFYPVIMILHYINAIMMKALRRSDDTEVPLVTEDELRHIIDVGEKEGTIKKTEREMIQKIFNLDEIPVRDVVTPRNEISSLDIKSTAMEAARLINETGYSRIPLYRNNPENLVGVVLAKDVLRLVSQGKDNAPMNKIKQQILFVPEFQKLDSLMRLFKKKKIHIAAVVDEHGGIVGVVTIEDALEQIVGEIYDEHDKVEKHIAKVNSRTIIVKGDTPIEELNNEIGTKISDEEFDTVSGMILVKLGRFPKKKEKLHFKEFDCIVEKTTKNRIVSVKIIMS